MRKCYRCLSALARGGPDSAGCADRAPSELSSERAARPGSGNGQLQYRRSESRSAGPRSRSAVRTTRGAVARAPIDEPFLTPACRRAATGAPIEAQAKQRSGVPARLDEAFRQELLVGCGNRGSRGSKLGREGAGRRKLVARSVDAIIDLRLQCFIATFRLWHHFPVSDWPTNIAPNWPFKVACVSPR